MNVTVRLSLELREKPAKTELRSNDNLQPVRFIL